MQPADDRGARNFRMEDMTLAFDDDLVTRVGMAEQGAEVAHRPAWNEERRPLADHLGSTFLQPVDGGVFVPDIVADFGGGHRPTHRLGRERKGIAAQLDDPLHHQSLSNLNRPPRGLGPALICRAGHKSAVSG